MFKNRTVGEILVLMVAITVCGYVVVSAMSIVLITIFRPSTDVTNAARNVADVINTLIGLLAGFLAGRTDVLTKHHDQIKKLTDET